MGATLTAQWLGDADAVAVVDEASVSAIRQDVRTQGLAAGLGRTECESLVTAASEMAHNHLRHARRGRIAVRRIQRNGTPGLEVIAVDEGEGIEDPTAALLGGTSSTGLGVGLGAIYRLADEVDIDVRRCEGTCVVARKLAVAPRARSEVAIVGRPHPTERISGDDAAIVRTEAGLLMVVCDGLGHGPSARQASQRLVGLCRPHADATPEELVRLADAALVGTRGAVASVVRVDNDAIVHVGVGNVTTQVHAHATTRRFVNESRVIGNASQRPRMMVERLDAAPGQTLVMFSDGVSSRADVSSDPALLRQPPIVIAQAVLERFGRDTDDAMVLVARHPALASPAANSTSVASPRV